MSRLVALLCLALALLCPALCLAETAGDECGLEDGGVCGVMADGAIVAAPADGPASPHEMAPALDGLFPLSLPASDAPCLWSATRCDRRPQKVPPSASRRQALLQTFLF